MFYIVLILLTRWFAYNTIPTYLPIEQPNSPIQLSTYHKLYANNNFITILHVALSFNFWRLKNVWYIIYSRSFITY